MNQQFENAVFTAIDKYFANKTVGVKSPVFNNVNTLANIKPVNMRGDVHVFEATVSTDGSGNVTITQPDTVQIDDGKKFLIRKMRTVLIGSKGSSPELDLNNLKTWLDDLKFNFQDASVQTWFSENIPIAAISQYLSKGKETGTNLTGTYLSGDIDFTEFFYGTTSKSQIKCTIYGPSSVSTDPNATILIKIALFGVTIAAN